MFIVYATNDRYRMIASGEAMGSTSEGIILRGNPRIKMVSFSPTDKKGMTIRTLYDSAAVAKGTLPLQEIRLPYSQYLFFEIKESKTEEPIDEGNQPETSS